MKDAFDKRDRLRILKGLLAAKNLFELFSSVISSETP